METNWTDRDILEFEEQNGVDYGEVLENEVYEIYEYGF